MDLAPHIEYEIMKTDQQVLLTFYIRLSKNTVL